LMRRALAGIVPSEILERKRKAYVSRGLVRTLGTLWQGLNDDSLVVQEMGWADSTILSHFVERAEQGQEIPILPLLRTLALEYWLRELAQLRHQLPITAPAKPAHAVRN